MPPTCDHIEMFVSYSIAFKEPKIHLLQYHNSFSKEKKNITIHTDIVIENENNQCSDQLTDGVPVLVVWYCIVMNSGIIKLSESLLPISNGLRVT